MKTKVLFVCLIVISLVLSACTPEESAHITIDNLDEIPSGPAGADGVAGPAGADGINGNGVMLNEPGAADNFLTAFDNVTGAHSKAQPTITNVSGLTAALAGKEPTLGFTPEDTANKGAANGYASLNATGKVPNSQIDFPAAGSGDMLKATYDPDTDGVIESAQLDVNLEYVTNKNLANGYPGLDATNNITSSIANASQIKGGSSNQIIKWVGTAATWYSVLQSDILTWLGYTPADNVTAMAHYADVANPHSVTANQVLPAQGGHSG